MSGSTSPRATSHSAQGDEGVAGNARLTSSVAVVLIALLFLEGLTLLQLEHFVRWHVFLGLVVIPPVLLKLASTTWRFAKYYRGDASYTRKGPPALILRLLGPVIIILTAVLLGTGVGLLVHGSPSLRSNLVELHKLSFIAWFGATTVHVIGHAVETAALAPRDWLHRYRRDVAGASWRQWALAVSLIAGILLALWLTPYANGWTIIG